VQAARAANMVYGILVYRRGLEREEMPPVGFTLLLALICECVRKMLLKSLSADVGKSRH